MKLARPDVFHPRIVLAGSPRRVAGDADDADLVSVLGRRGLHARWLSWDAADVARADLVILRSTHDYATRLDEFLAWTEGVPNLLNSPAAVAWNADRRSLDDLADRGVATVPGEAFAPGERVRLPRNGPAFVGPTPGSGARRCDDRAAAAAYAAELHASGRGVWVQPAATRETVLIFLGGRPSHAFPPEPDFEVWDVGAAALAAAAERIGVRAAEFLYARAHLAGDPARLVELQLIDPSLGWLRLDADARGLAQREFALAVESACERLGLGPFSHRGP